MNQKAPAPTIHANPDPHASHRAVDVLTFALGTAVALLAAGYLTHMPITVGLPGAVKFVALVIAVAGNGYLFGRLTRRTWRGGVVTAVLASIASLVFMGSLFEHADSRQAAMLGLPGYIATIVIIFLIAAALGRRTRAAEPNTPRNWSLALVGVAIAATALVIAAGGLVTGHGAGFSVHDWPTSEGANMFLYPLSKMVGGKFYEHAHRLAGALVGVIAIVVMAHRWVVAPGKASAWVATAALIMVIVQGIVGGLWVTKGVESPDAKPLGLVIFHGTFAQLTLAVFVVLAAMTSRTWRDPQARLAVPSITTDRVFGVLATSLLFVQLVLGVVLRQANKALIEHVVFAFVVGFIIMAQSARAAAKHGERSPALRRTGNAVAVLLITQITLGFVALLVRRPDQAAPEIGSAAVTDAVDAFVTTLHQSTGAALLCTVALLTAWSFRLLRQAEPTADTNPAAAATDAEPAEPSHVDTLSSSPRSHAHQG